MREEGGVPEGKRVLRDAFKRLEREVPEGVARALRWLRHPKSRLVRIPVGALFIIGGFFSFLPVLGIWMLPLGLLLIAYDVPFLRKPVGRFTIWGAEKWAAFRRLAGSETEPQVRQEQCAFIAQVVIRAPRMRSAESGCAHASGSVRASRSSSQPGRSPFWVGEGTEDKS
jgi:hypothetical protein